MNPVTNPHNAPDGYDASNYERPSVTVDTAVFTIRNGAFSVLLVERKDLPYQGFWALPGGFVEPDEDLDIAAYRELEEETGIASSPTRPVFLEQLATYGSPRRDPRTRVISVAYIAVVPDLPTPLAGSDASSARWVAVDDLGSLDLAFDHEQILSDAIERVRSKFEYTPAATEFVVSPFTLRDLHRVYETVWGTEVHYSNFVRKLQAVDGFLVLVDSAAEPTGPGRPPKLYRSGDARLLMPPLMRHT